MTFGGSWDNQPLAVTEFQNATIYRSKFDLTNVTQARVVVNYVGGGAASAKIRAQFSTDQSSWTYLDGAAGPSVTLSAAGLNVSPWINIQSGAKSDVFLRIVGLDGNGAADPAFSRIDIQVK